jgi:hypothetical protein
MGALVSRINSARGGADPTALLSRLKTNLNTVADNFALLQQAEQNR